MPLLQLPPLVALLRLAQECITSLRQGRASLGGCRHVAGTLFPGEKADDPFLLRLRGESEGDGLCGRSRGPLPDLRNGDRGPGPRGLPVSRRSPDPSVPAAAACRQPLAPGQGRAPPPGPRPVWPLPDPGEPGDRPIPSRPVNRVLRRQRQRRLDRPLCHMPRPDRGSARPFAVSRS